MIILALPMSKKYPVILLVFAAFLIPVFISSAVYVKLIYSRKKIFKNRIETLTETVLDDHNAPHSPNNRIFHTQVSVNDVEKDVKFLEQEEEKTTAQMLAATRSLKTNFALGIVFSAIEGTDVIYPTHYTYFLASLLKGIMPIITTVANFGTIKDMTSQYWKHFKQLYRSFTKSNGEMNSIHPLSIST